ncbi:hypothetical protein TWF694_006306 [Orbilia ellipsospora]|uniref:Uncharacterized protein n=1 Tax=Orbilia ellipsospora TaxID=2528407 RepID=A0AAV9XN51_9PEZI
MKFNALIIVIGFACITHVQAQYRHIFARACITNNCLRAVRGRAGVGPATTDCSSHLRKTTTITVKANPPTTATTITPTGSIASKPAYASACAGNGYSSACSCIGVRREYAIETAILVPMAHNAVLTLASLVNAFCSTVYQKANSLRQLIRVEEPESVKGI